MVGRGEWSRLPAHVSRDSEKTELAVPSLYRRGLWGPDGEHGPCFVLFLLGTLLGDGDRKGSLRARL